jgi:hypothetical protein
LFLFRGLAVTILIFNQHLLTDRKEVIEAY